jgi:hypothetical protein
VREAWLQGHLVRCSALAEAVHPDLGAAAVTLGAMWL